jgi:hypothetical protein
VLTRRLVLEVLLERHASSAEYGARAAANANATSRGAAAQQGLVLMIMTVGPEQATTLKILRWYQTTQGLHLTASHASQPCCLETLSAYLLGGSASLDCACCSCCGGAARCAMYASTLASPASMRWRLVRPSLLQRQQGQRHVTGDGE